MYLHIANEFISCGHLGHHCLKVEQTFNRPQSFFYSPLYSTGTGTCISAASLIGERFSRLLWHLIHGSTVAHPLLRNAIKIMLKILMEEKNNILVLFHTYVKSCFACMSALCNILYICLFDYHPAFLIIGSR